MMKDNVEKFYNINKEKKDIEKELKDLRGKILEDMNGEEELIEGNYKISYKPSVSYTVDEDKLVQKIKDYVISLDDPDIANKINECLKVKLVVDEDKLESLIYNGLIPEDIGSDCTTKKETYRFTVNLIKKTK